MISALKNAPVRRRQGKLLGQGLFDLRAHVGAQVELFFELDEPRRAPGGDLGLDLWEQCERSSQAAKVSRTGASRRHARGQALQVVGALELFAEIPAQNGVAGQFLDGIEPSVDRGHVGQRVR